MRIITWLCGNMQITSPSPFLLTICVPATATKGVFHIYCWSWTQDSGGRKWTTTSRKRTIILIYCAAVLLQLRLIKCTESFLLLNCIRSKEIVCCFTVLLFFLNCILLFFNLCSILVNAHCFWKCLQRNWLYSSVDTSCHKHYTELHSEITDYNNCSQTS